MRLSGNKDNKHYHPIAPFVDVFVDGKPEHHAISVDTDACSYEVYVTPLKCDNDGNFVSEIRHGNIVLDFSLAPQDVLDDFLNKQGEKE